jgi:hypothetical protein
MSRKVNWRIPCYSPVKNKTKSIYQVSIVDCGR